MNGLEEDGRRAVGGARTNHGTGWHERRVIFAQQSFPTRIDAVARESMPTFRGCVFL